MEESKICHGSKRHNMHNESDFKTRNILTLEQRIAVLREYDKKPVYQPLATKFKCSAKQIKTIVLKRKTIELEMSKLTAMTKNNASSSSPSSEAVATGNTIVATNNPQSLQMHQDKRNDKIVFMSTVIYEFLQRATYYKHQINTHAVLKMAEQVKEAIAIENFKPNANWLKNFMGTLNVKNFDLNALTERFALMGPKEPSLCCYDIIEYVRLQEQGNLMRNPQDENYHHSITIKTEEDMPEQNPMLDDVLQPPQLELNATGLIPEISNLAEAMNYLKALQDYALIQENFRAVGLLTQVEEVIQNPPDSQDFEVP